MKKELYDHIFNKRKLNPNRTHSYYIHQHFPIVYDLINENEITELRFKEKLFCYIFDINETPKCKNPKCNHRAIFYKFSKGYSNYCSSKCAYKNFSSNISAIKKISEAQINIRNKNLLEKYKNLSLDLSIDKNDIILKNYCKHGNVHLSIEEFRKNLYHNNQTHCTRCHRFFSTSWKPISIDMEKEYDFFIHVLLEKSNHNLTEKRILKYFPKLYKCIKDYTKLIKNINWSEKIHMFKNQISSRPVCVNCKLNEVHFSESIHQYTKHCDICCDNQDFLITYKNFISKKETEVFKYVQSLYTGAIIRNKRFKKELDIHVPDLNLAFEFNGLYWHSENFRDKDYHLKKLNHCKELGIKLINIWEDDWDFKADLIKSMIKNQLKLNQTKIYARKCEIKIVNYKDTKEFLDKNHIQGNLPSAVKLGLFYDNKLVSLMTFGKKRMIMKSVSLNSNEYELLRFCNLQDTSVIGGASKLFMHFIKTYNPKSIVSYANQDYSDGNLYKILGFNKMKKIEINYWWAKNGVKYHRSNFMKHKLIEQGADPNKTEDEIMKNNGYMKIWGTGNLKYEWTIE